MEIVDLYDAKTDLSRLLDRAAAGEDIVIAREGKPLARLVRCVAQRQPVVFGALAGQIVIPDNFDDPLDDDFMAAFDGRSP